MTTDTFTVHIEQKILEKLDSLATATGRSRNDLVNAAIERFVAEEGQFVASVQRGLEDLKAGRTTPHEEVFRELRAEIEDKRG